MKFKDIMDEIKDGRRFSHFIDGGVNCWYKLDQISAPFVLEHLFSDNWELEPIPEKKKELTRSMILDAYKKALYKLQERTIGSCYLNPNPTELMCYVLGELDL